MDFLAHIDNERESGQLLREHLKQVAELASGYASRFGASQWAEYAGLLHDIGKYSKNFQDRIRGASVRCDHATAGALEIYKLQQRPMAHILAYCIAGHHGGLPKGGTLADTYEDSTLCGRLQKKFEGNNDYAVFTREINLSEIKKLNPPHITNTGFSVAYFIRMIYSCLTDADFLDTEAFMKGGVPRGNVLKMGQLAEIINKYLLRFDGRENEINRKRTQICNICLKKSTMEQGMFTLTVPTGGGKTLTSMGFAANHALKHDLDRIIYVIPFTSIIEQNAAVFKEIFGPEHVLEHHSNFDFREDGEFASEQELRIRLACENWDAPIIVTTNVQFFESMFAHKSSRCRKLHNMANSVIILDEAQMLPVEYLTPCLNALYELVRNYASTVVLCSATQPEIQKYLPIGLTVTEISENTQMYYEAFKRVQVTYLNKVDDEEIMDLINSHEQALCIVNTRAHARALFDNLKGEGNYHLSTLMCPRHRKEAIWEIKERLRKNMPCKVISTSLLEAGVDIDFPYVYRALAGLDSIVQSAGRCNREGKTDLGRVFVFEPDSLHQKKPPAYVARRAQISKVILEKYEDPVCLEAIREYFRSLYELEGEQGRDREGIMEMHEANRSRFDFDFPEISNKFKLIEDNTYPIITPYDDDAKQLIEKMRTDKFPSKFKRPLQQYSINIYENEFRSLYSTGSIEVVNEMFFVLSDEKLYNRDKGLDTKAETGNALFY